MSAPDIPTEYTIHIENVNDDLLGNIRIKEVQPITLQGGQEGQNWWGVASRAQVSDLRTLAASPLAGPLLLTLEDGRTFNVRFRYENGSALEATPWKPIAVYEDSDFYVITLRLMQV